MPTFTYGQRLKIALGGLTLFIGLAILISIFLIAIGVPNIDNILPPSILTGVILAVGILDLLAAILLLRQ